MAVFGVQVILIVRLWMCVMFGCGVWWSVLRMSASVDVGQHGLQPAA
jgi:type IV secretory pathway TrbD component